MNTQDYVEDGSSTSTAISLAAYFRDQFFELYTSLRSSRRYQLARSLKNAVFRVLSRFEEAVESPDATSALLANDDEEQPKKYEIKEGDSGHSYETIFSMCINNAITQVTVEDPFIVHPYQIKNFLKFSEMLRCKAQNLDRVVLITQQRPEENPDQKTALDALSDSFRKHNITLNVVFREFHERYVRFNNGYEVSMTRGLDIYQPLARLALGTHHYSLRQCREATFHITKKN